MGARPSEQPIKTVSPLSLRKTPNGITLLVWSVAAEDEYIVNLCLEKTVDINGHTALTWALALGKLSLLRDSSDPAVENKSGMNALL